MALVAKRKEIDPLFGRRLRAFRDAKGWTQAQLGEAAGMRQNVVARLEAGDREPGWGTVQKLADALGVDVGEFRKGSDAATPDAEPEPERLRPTGKRK